MEKERELPTQGKASCPEKTKGKRPSGIWLAVFILGSVVLCCGVICLLANLRTTVFPHVTVLHTPVDGMTAEEVETLWQEQGADICKETIVSLTREGEREPLGEVSYTDLGFRVTPQEAADSAMAVGRSGNPAADALVFVKSWFSTIEAAPALRVDETILSERLKTIVETMDNTVTEGKTELLPEGKDGPGLYITKPRGGERVDGEALRRSLCTMVEEGPLYGVVCAFEKVMPEKLDAQKIYDALHGTVAEARYDKTDGKVTESRIGVDFDVDVVQEQIDKAKEGETFLAEATVTFPKASTELLRQALFRDVLGTCTTTVTGTASRIHNVYLAARRIDGKIYNPGETFWYNATVGQRTEEAGFGPAPSYVAGETVDSIGGGICQVSSTLYYAALRADMSIVMRYAHQFAPGYILWGCDATVSWGGCDFAFRNASDYPIKIVTEWSDDNRLTVTILGTKIDEGYVEMVNQVVSSTDWGVQYKIDEEMQPGDEPKEIQTPYTGYVVKTYRNHYNAAGELLSSTFETTSDYESRDRIYAVSRADYQKLSVANPGGASLQTTT